MRQAGVTVQVLDADGNPIGTATTDAIGAYTYRVPSGQSPALAIYSTSEFTSPAFTLGSANGNWFLDVQVVPEPGVAVATLIGTLLCGLRRRRVS